MSGLPGIDRQKPRKAVTDLVRAGLDHRPGERTDLELERPPSGSVTF
jgi:hypothetical protein